MKKEDSYYLAIYAIAIAIWDLAFTLIIAGGLQLVFYMFNVELWGAKELIIAYLIGYIILFATNLDIIEDEGE